MAAPEAGPSLALHGGAGGGLEELTLTARAPYEQGLRAAYRAGWQVLAAGAGALDAGCASVAVLEDDPLFNSGRGAALTATGQAELDASVMTGSGQAGAVAASRYARNPVALARAVMEHTDHVLIVDPDVAFLERHGLAVVDGSYFITEARQQQLDRLTGGRATAAATGPSARRPVTPMVTSPPPPPPAGWSARPRAASGQPHRRRRRPPRDQVVAISSTGHGEALRGVVAYDVAAGSVAGANLAQAVRGHHRSRTGPARFHRRPHRRRRRWRHRRGLQLTAMFSARGTSPSRP